MHMQYLGKIHTGMRGVKIYLTVTLEKDGLFNITLEDEETKLSKVDSLDDTLLSLLAMSEISAF